MAKKSDDFQRIKAQIEQRQYAPVYLLHGEEAFFSCRYCRISGAVDDIRAGAGALLSLHFRGTAPEWFCADLQRGGRDWGNRRRNRKFAGDGNDQVYSWRRQFIDWLPAYLQCAHGGIPQGKAPES